MKVKDITPAEAACTIGITCPSVREVTPPEAACFLSNCPSVHEVTPAEAACQVHNCPSVHEITPPEARCDVVVTCPSIFATEGFVDGGYIVVGKVSEEITQLVRHKVGPDESAVLIPRSLYEAIRNQGPVER